MTRHIIQITSSNIIHLSEEQTVQCFTWLEILPQLGDLFDYIFSSSLIKLNFLEDFQHGCTLYMYSPVEVIVSPSRSIWGSLLLFFFLPWYMQLLLDKIISYVFFFSLVERFSSKIIIWNVLLWKIYGFYKACLPPPTLDFCLHILTYFCAKGMNWVSFGTRVTNWGNFKINIYHVAS